MIKKLAIALSVTTICSNIHPAYASPSNEALEVGKGRITVKRATVKRSSVKRAPRERRLERRTRRVSNAAGRAERLNMRRSIRSQRMTETRNIRIVRKTRARFDTLLMRANFQEAVRASIQAPVAQQIMEPIAVSRTLPLVAVQHLQTRTVGMDASHQPIDLAPIRLVKLDEKRAQVSLTDLNPVLTPLTSPVREEKAPSTIVQPVHSGVSLLDAASTSVNSGIAHLTDGLNKIKEDSLNHPLFGKIYNSYQVQQAIEDHLFPNVSDPKNNAIPLEDQKNKMEELSSVSGWIKENLASLGSQLEDGAEPHSQDISSPQAIVESSQQDLEDAMVALGGSHQTPETLLLEQTPILAVGIQQNSQDPTLTETYLEESVDVDGSEFSNLIPGGGSPTKELSAPSSSIQKPTDEVKANESEYRIIAGVRYVKNLIGSLVTKNKP